MCVEPDSNSQCCISHSSIGGAQKRPISFGLAPGYHLLLESSPAPTTNLVYQLLIPSTLPTFLIPPLGVLWENDCLPLPHTCQLAPGRNAPHWAPAPVGPQVKFQGRGFSLFILPLWRAICGGNRWGCSQVRPCSIFCSVPGTSSSIGHDFRNGHRHPDGL